MRMGVFIMTGYLPSGSGRDKKFQGNERKQKSEGDEKKSFGR